MTSLRQSLASKQAVILPFIGANITKFECTAIDVFLWGGAFCFYKEQIYNVKAV